MFSWLTIFIIFVVFNIYLVIGMVTFHFMESETEEAVRQDTKVYKDAILANFTCLTEESLEKLIHAIRSAVESGVDPSNSSSAASNWGWSDAFFFSGTIVTTIGYGHITPNTLYGRFFSIFYAVIGIPICGLLVSGLAAKFIKFKERILECAYKKVEKRWLRKVFSLVIINILGSVLFVTIPSIIYGVVEGWSYGEAVYCCLITLTTVGFGDYVPGHNPDIQYYKVYKAMRLYWVLLGLVYVTTIIQTISDAFTGATEEAEKMKNKASVRLKGQKIGISNGHCQIRDERGRSISMQERNIHM